MTRALASSILAFALVLPIGASAVRQQPSQPVAGRPDRLAQMQHHFVQVGRIHEAIVRGDLAAVGQPARQLATMPAPPGIPMKGAPFVGQIRVAAREAADATNLVTAASATASMLTICGDCHRAVGVSVAPVGAGHPDVGGIVGHMLEHRLAVDEMLQGLFIPAETQWRDGASRLRMAPLLPESLPPDPGLTKEAQAADAAVHAIAEEATQANTPAARAAVYTKLVTTCAACHGIHSRIWGPTGR